MAFTLLIRRVIVSLKWTSFLLRTTLRLGSTNGVGNFLIQPEVYATGMTREIDRCRWALEKAQRSKTVALVCSGDAGVYGMASPLLELAGNYPDVEVEIVPGLTAALSGGAVLERDLVAGDHRRPSLDGTPCAR